MSSRRCPSSAHGRERWWRTFPTDHREPDYDSLSAGRTGPRSTSGAPPRSPAKLELVNRFVREVRQHGKWAKASRAGGYFTAEDLDALFEGYLALLNKYGRTRRTRRPGATDAATDVALPDRARPARVTRVSA